jgi:hypothetical protein
MLHGCKCGYHIRYDTDAAIQKFQIKVTNVTIYKKYILKKYNNKIKEKG